MISYPYLPRLTAIREARGWTVEDLAARSGYHELTIRRAEGRIKTMRGVRARTANEIAQALDVTLDDLLGKKLPKPGQMQANYQRRLLRALEVLT